MTIETKFDIEDTAFLMHHNIIIECIIKSFRVSPFNGNINYPIEDNIFYGICDKRGWEIEQGNAKFIQHRLFKTKEELLNSL